MPYKANQACRHKIPRARYRVTNWPEYDRALQQRGSLTVWVTPEALAAWHPPKTGRRGRSPQYADIAIETGHLLRLAFGRPWRQTEGLPRSLAALLGLDIGIPDHTTFSRRSPGLSLAKALAQAQRSGPVHVAIDSTGLKVHGAGEWLAETHGGRGRRSWRKLHLAVDPASGEILASALTTTEEGATQHPRREVQSRVGAQNQAVRSESWGEELPGPGGSSGRRVVMSSWKSPYGLTCPQASGVSPRRSAGPIPPAQIGSARMR